MQQVENQGCGLGRVAGQWKRPIVAGLAALALAAALAACTAIVRSAEPFAAQPAKPRPEAPALSPQKGVILLAEARGNTVWVTVFNYTDKPVRVGPETFAVIVGRHLYKVNRGEVIVQFPYRTLRREEGVSGAFRFRRLSSLEGQKLVFNSPDTERQMVIIGRRKLPTASYRTLLPPRGRRELRRLRREEEETRKALLRELQQR